MVAVTSEWAPHACTGTLSDGHICGAPAYIGFGVPPKCVLTVCPNYDEKTSVEWNIEQEKLRVEPTWEDTFRDFCGHCHEAVDFNRYRYPTGELSAWCPSCGHGNYWNADLFDEDTQPGIPYSNQLDVYGKLMGLARIPGESDEDYTDRLLALYNVGGRP